MSFIVRSVLGLLSLLGLHACQEPPLESVSDQDEIVQISPRVVGGRLSDIQEWPFLVSIRGKHPISGEPITFCGGAAISDRWVLTAAHCLVYSDTFPDSENPTHHWPKKTTQGNWEHEAWGKLQVVANTDDLASESKSAIFDIQDVVIHEKYRPVEGSRVSAYDLALVKIYGKLDDFARLSKDKSTDPTAHETRAFVAGFGSTSAVDNRLKQFTYDPSGETGLALSRFLRQAVVPVVSGEACKAAYSDHDSENHLCAGYKSGGQDACTGDSGGPLITRDVEQTPYLVGVVSFGRGCGTSLKNGGGYGVYERVSSRIEWINETVRDLNIQTLAPESRSQAFLGLAVDFEQQLTEIKERQSVDTAGLSFEGYGEKIEIQEGSTVTLRVATPTEGYLIVFDIDAEGAPSLVAPYFSEDRDRMKVGPSQPFDLPLYAVKTTDDRIESGKLIAAVVPKQLFEEFIESVARQRSETQVLFNPSPEQFEVRRYQALYELLQSILDYTSAAGRESEHLKQIAFSTLTYEIVW